MTPAAQFTGRLCPRPGKAPRSLFFLLIFTISTARLAAQTAVIDDAWWAYQQDCNGDGCYAGTLTGDAARLTWNPDVQNCNGTISVYEIVYTKDCADPTWVPIYTNALHSITGCRSSDAQFIDIPMGSGCACRDYRIEIYRAGQSVPDNARSSTNDPDLFHHQEQLLSEDACLNDSFAGCAALSGGQGVRFDNNLSATQETGEPDHAGNPGGKSLWYCWTAPTSQPVTFDTTGSSFDTLLAVYTGSDVAALSLVTNNDDIDGANDRMSRLTFTPQAGVTYHVAVDGFGGASGTVTLDWKQAGSALPDLVLWGPAVSPTVVTRTFATNDCEVLEGCAITGKRTLLSFSTETRNIGAGDLALGNPATNSLFEWASCHGHYHFEEFAQYDLLDSNNTVVAFGHKVGFCLVDDHPWSPGASSQARYTCGYQGIQAGWADVYGAGLPCQYIDITGVPPGQYTLRLLVNPYNLIQEADTNNNTTLVTVTIPPTNCVSPPDNDAFANATVIPSVPWSLSQPNYCASKQSGEPSHAGQDGGHSVWFNWTPSSSAQVVINTRRSDFDTLLAVYTGTSVNSLAPVTYNDNIGGGILQSQVSFFANAGTTYRIAVDGYLGAVGTVVLNLNPPANDDFAAAFAITGTTGSTNGSNLGASKEPLEPAHAFDVGGHSIWYRWTAPADGPVDFNTMGSGFDTSLAVYTGTSVTNLTLIASNNDDVGGAQTSRLGFEASAGTVYRIVVDGWGGVTGNLTLNWTMDSTLAIAPLAPGQVLVTVTGIQWQRYVLLDTPDPAAGWGTNTAAQTLSGGSLVYTNSATQDQQFFRFLRVP
ncbi:MAG: lysyl oxidase family protein [Verrucomicrobiota bacterium]